VKTERQNGRVYLIGAGPGDPELLTLKAVRALGEADVVLIDDLVDRRVLEYAPRARVVPVGKRGGCRSTPQQFIERLMVRLARRGHVVARVKGGDPFVFGRGGEEALVLAAAGIECRVIPGITSGVGVPAALGIPVTHRDLARGVTFVTAHTRDGNGPDWAALARTGTTLVIYMGMQRIGEIAAALGAAGMSATPAAVIERGTTENERSVIGNVANMAGLAAAAGLGSPALIVIGEVVRLARTVESAPPQRLSA
jgi:uroporphyrin-III C-methyltransferase